MTTTYLGRNRKIGLATQEIFEVLGLGYLGNRAGRVHGLGLGLESSSPAGLEPDSDSKVSDSTRTRTRSSWTRTRFCRTRTRGFGTRLGLGLEVIGLGLETSPRWRTSVLVASYPQYKDGRLLWERQKRFVFHSFTLRLPQICESYPKLFTHLNCYKFCQL